MKSISNGALFELKRTLMPNKPQKNAMTDTDQLASEAAQEYRKHKNESGPLYLESIIKTTIEKACMQQAYNYDAMWSSKLSSAIEKARLDGYTEGYNKSVGQWLRGEHPKWQDVHFSEYSYDPDCSCDRCKPRSAHASDQGAVSVCDTCGRKSWSLEETVCGMIQPNGSCCTGFMRSQRPTPATDSEPRTHHNTCPKGDRCACYITGYTDAEYDHGLALDSLEAKPDTAPTGREWTVESLLATLYTFRQHERLTWQKTPKNTTENAGKDSN